jgi:hypothetical protein
MMIAGIRPVKPLSVLLLILTAGACLAADTFKWVDDKGVTNYGEKPPQSRPAQPVNTNPSGIVEGGDQFSQKAVGEKRLPEVAPRTALGPAPVPGSMATRGMDFDVFIRLQTGMTEGELLLRAGSPDYEGMDNIRHDIVKSYYYFPTVANPYTTVVTLRGGRIANLERIKKF